MHKHHTREDLLEWADVFFAGRHGLIKRKTFSCPSYYHGKKMVAFLHEDALVVKTDPGMVLLKIESDPDVYGHFSPSGHVMKNWLTITRPEASEYDQDIPDIEEWMNAGF